MMRSLSGRSRATARQQRDDLGLPPPPPAAPPTASRPTARPCLPRSSLCPPLLLLLLLAAAPVASRSRSSSGGGASIAERAHHIRKVSIVFSWHLDVGFNAWPGEPGLDSTVISRHFNEFFPRAARLAQQLRERGDRGSTGGGGGERLVVLTHVRWLLRLAGGREACTGR